METIKPTSSNLQVAGSAEGAMERAPRATGIAPSAGGRQLIPSPDPEVPEIKPRRKFTAKYKLEILEQRGVQGRTSVYKLMYHFCFNMDWATDRNWGFLKCD